MKRITVALVAGLIFLLAPVAFSQDILVWDKDHGKLFQDPEGAGLVDASYGVTKALTDCGYTFDVTTSPNPNLGAYDILFLIMGTYC